MPSSPISLRQRKAVLTCAIFWHKLGLPTLEHCHYKAHEAMEQSLSRYLLPKRLLRTHNASRYIDCRDAVGRVYRLAWVGFKSIGYRKGVRRVNPKQEAVEIREIETRMQFSVFYDFSRV